ncbi:glycosyltransferase family 4 protein [Candidatus Gottesmanbacteria bacterium]|nr:glycosyltransferase family 4 protein [Candidatus Gottesmanbacteria bacterium]
MIICSPQLGLSPESNLGGEVHDREMLKALDGLGIETLIILPFGKRHPVFKHAKIYFLPISFVYPPYLFNFLILPYLFFLYWKYQFDILRVHSPYFVGFGALIFKIFFPRVKIVVTYHHVEPKYKIFDNYLLNKFDLVTVVSEETKKELGKGMVIPNGIDPKYKPQLKNQKLLEKYNIKNKKVLLYLGRLIERKNIPFLFKIIKKLSNDYILLICGDGPLSDNLEKTAPEKVIFTGRISEEQKVDYYNLADVFVYPSLKEGYGLSVAEAIACGKPVVASNVPIVFHTPLDVDVWIREIRDVKFSKTTLITWNKIALKYLSFLSDTPN